MNREFLRNILFVVSINLLIKPVYIFGIDRTVQNLVGPESYGLYFALLNLTYLLQILNDFGIQNFNNRHVSQSRHLLGKYFPQMLTVKLLLGLGYSLITLLAAVFLGYSLSDFHLLAFLILNQFLVSMIFFLRSNISGLGMYRLDSVLSGADKFLMILLCGALILLPSTSEGFQIEWFVYCQTASLVLVIGIVLVLLRGKLARFRFRFRLPVAIVILKKSLPFATIILLMTAYTRIDGIMLERLLGDGEREAGIYASAYRLLDAGNMIGYLFAGLLLPMFSRMLSEGVRVHPLVRVSFRLMWLGALSLSFSVFFFRGEIMELLYTEADAYWGEVLGWLIFSFVGVGVSYIFGTLLTAQGSLDKLNRYFAAGVFINIALNFILIPAFKAEGAAMATLVTQLLVMLAQVYQAERIFPGLLDLPLLRSAALLLGLILLISWTGYEFFPFEWPIRFAGTFLVCVLMAFLTGWFRLYDLNDLIRGKGAISTFEKAPCDDNRRDSGISG
jgi:O-antigen/teichoic acid export membrane protein